MQDLILIFEMFTIIAIMLILIIRLHVHPFIAIMTTTLALALVTIPLDRIPATINNGFGGIFSTIALIVIFGAIIGIIMEKTSAALKLAEMIIRCVGKKHPEIAMMLMGWVISIPVFCDSGFILLNPIRKALCLKTKASAITMATALGAGLFSTHCLVPPTPGPVAAAGFTGMENNLLWIIVIGAIISVPTLLGAWIYIHIVGSKIKHTEETQTESLDDLLANWGVLPNGWHAILPIAVPILLMSMGSVASFLKLDGNVGKLSLFLGAPVIALGAGVLVALTLLLKCGKINKITSFLEETFKITAPILFITGAGSMLGKVIVEAGFIELIQRHVAFLSVGGILLPFLIATLLKTAQGSSTVAMITTAAILGSYTDPLSLMTALGLTTPWDAALTVSAIGVGAMTVSHANDSYFWVVAQFSGQTPQVAYKSFSLATLCMGISGMSAILLLKGLF